MDVPRESKNVALDVIEGAVRAGGSSLDWERRVLEWAKENGRGMYHPAIIGGPELTYEYNDYLRSIGRL